MALTGAVVLITGGTQGIGRATALRLAQDGAQLVINYSSNSKAAEDLVQQIGSDRALAFKADASQISGIEELVNATVERFGKIDIVIPNATLIPLKDLERTSEEDFDSTFALNVKGPYFLVQKALPHMPPGSRVIFLSTSVCAASTVTPAYLLYASSKGAIEQMTRVLAKDLARKGILVNAIAPGPIATGQFSGGIPEPMLKALAGMSPHNRIGSVEEMADTIAFLSGKESRWISGQIIRVNGAMT
ncbi:hypothetical protein MMC07_002518 [Pseudocyphellaria aurata]|nr:hypothetical protein [Pseudocyphellaria aurata]